MGSDGLFHLPISFLWQRETRESGVTVWLLLVWLKVKRRFDPFFIPCICQQRPSRVFRGYHPGVILCLCLGFNTAWKPCKTLRHVQCHFFSKLGDCGHAGCRSDYRHDDRIRGAWGIILSRILHGGRRHDLGGNTHYDGARFLYPKETTGNRIANREDWLHLSRN